MIIPDKFPFTVRWDSPEEYRLFMAHFNEQDKPQMAVPTSSKDFFQTHVPMDIAVIQGPARNTKHLLAVLDEYSWKEVPRTALQPTIDSTPVDNKLHPRFLAGYDAGVKDTKSNIEIKNPIPIDDSIFLSWVADRLVYVHGDKNNIDFVQRLRKMAAEEAEPKVPEIDYTVLAEFAAKEHISYNELCRAVRKAVIKDLK